MKCPRCHAELAIEMHEGIEVDRCPDCGGMWLDYGEIHDLEDTVWDKKSHKGSLMFRSFDGKLACPKCEGRMQRFNYRAYHMELDFCEHEHGIWLDAGEEKRVIELMKKRTKDLGRKQKAEAEWDGLLKSIGSPSFMDKAKRLFKK